jgi:hypothetical protein
MKTILAWLVLGRHLVQCNAMRILRVTPRWSAAILGIAISFLGAKSQAAEFGRAVTVISTISSAHQRPAAPDSADNVIVVVNSAPWGTSSCRPDAVSIPKSDTHILAQLLAALASGTTITFYVEETLKPVDGWTCQVTAMTVNQ